MTNEQLNQIAKDLYDYVVTDDAADGYVYTQGTAEGAADFWVESWYAMDDHSSFHCTEEELIPTSELLIPILVSLGLPQG
jgi:hypothetical protein